MSTPSRLPAVLVYLIPIIGWIYVFFFQRKNGLAIYHLRQALGLFLFLAAALIGWVVIAWVIALIPYMAVLSIALFAIVIAIYLFGLIAWIMGLMNALRNQLTPLPGLGQWASRLPIQ